MRKGLVLYALEGHADSITGVRLSPNGNYLLSNAMDNTLRTWDVRPYVSGQRAVAVYEGVQVRCAFRVLVLMSDSTTSRSSCCGARGRPTERAFREDRRTASSTCTRWPPAGLSASCAVEF